MAGEPCSRCGGHGLCYCPLPVAPPSFTDEDVERVAEALWRKEFDQTPDQMREQSRREHESDGWVDDYVEACEDTARAALSAYLQPTTKGDT